MARNNDPIYKKIFNDLERRISSGSYLPGMQIDSEQQLATAWSCSRHTVRKALLALSKRGLLQQRAGRGWFVASKKIRVQGSGQILCIGWQPTDEQHELCADHGYQLVRHENNIHRHELLDEACNNDDIVGIVKIEMRHADLDFIRSLREHGKHIVLAGLAEPSICDVVSLDFFRASMDIVELALAKGHKHIAFLGRHLHLDIPPFKRRVEGYLHACQLHGLTPYTWIAPREMYAASNVSEWNVNKLREHPEVSCCLLDSHSTAQCLEAFITYKSIPDELIVAGYGNGRLSFGQSLPVKSFDAIYEAWEDVNHLAVRRMLDRLDGDTSRPNLSLIPCDFIRGETGVF